jgi:hypothetical protein
VSFVEVGYDEQLALARGELARLVLRLRSLSLAAWRTRRKAALVAFGQLAELSAQAEHRRMPGLPKVADHALADAIAVVGGDAIAALGAEPNADLLAAVVAALREALETTR